MDNVKYGFSDLEPLRKKLQFMNKLIKIGSIIFFVLIGATGLLLFVNFNLGRFMILLLFIIFPIMCVLVGKISPEVKKEYMTAYKETLVIPTLSQKFDHYTYSMDGKVTIDDIKNLGIWNTKQEPPLQAHTEDFLTGTYHGVYYEQTDAHIWYKARANSNETVTAFNGTISKFRFNKKISGRLLLSHGFLGGRCSDGGLPQIKTENMEFNKIFTVNSEDGHDAFYILTPHFMECLMKLYNTLPGFASDKTIVVIFENDTMTILRGGVRMFELSIAEKVDYFEAKKTISKEMQDMLDIVDILRIGTENKPQETAENSIAGNSNAANEEIQDNDNTPVAKFRLK